MNLTAQYAGLTLPSPLIAASSGFTASVPQIIKLAQHGAGAVVIKSLFEEQIVSQALSMQEDSRYYEGVDYLQQYVQAHEIDKHLSLIKEAKKAVSIPVIASINCYHSGQWVDFAKQMQDAGADAIELNIMRLETDRLADESKLASSYVTLCADVAKATSIPVCVKLDKQFMALSALVDKLRTVGIKGITCFNRSYQTDIDVEKLTIRSGQIFTSSQELSDTLKHTAILSAQFPKLPISASGGVHQAEDIVKCLLAGASSVQVASALYLHGADYVQTMLQGLKNWMTRKAYQTVDEFKGLLNAKQVEDRSKYERMQFMRYFSDHQEVL